MPISANKWSHLNRYERLYLQPVMDLYDQIEAMEEDVLMLNIISCQLKKLKEQKIMLLVMVWLVMNFILISI
jgi:hypothetical protein